MWGSGMCAGGHSPKSVRIHRTAALFLVRHSEGVTKQSLPRIGCRPTRKGSAVRGNSANVQAIQELILREGLRPGEPLPPESVLCDHLNASRSSVREAIRTLVSLDIVEVRHGYGTFVGQMSLTPLVNGLLFRARLNDGHDLRALREVVQVRIALDLSVGEELVDVYRGTVQGELNQIVVDMRRLADHGESFMEQDAAFHARLLEPLHNELIQQLGAAFWQIHTAALPLLGIAPSQDILETVNAHQTMLDALIAGDLEAYRDAVHAHYRPLMKALSGKLQDS